jgi:hypothetical protein
LLLKSNSNSSNKVLLRIVNDVTVLKGGDQGSCDNRSKAWVLKSVTIKIVQNSVTTFMDDPLQRVNWIRDGKYGTKKKFF